MSAVLKSTYEPLMKLYEQIKNYEAVITEVQELEKSKAKKQGIADKVIEF